ncbi:MAG: hypothetical protein JSV80_00200 [Acidobacteriota bacterium]|nr:MAG: hypothetical protein JSV80_00200 [Acidobacteriota bacterium]
MSSNRVDLERASAAERGRYIETSLRAEAGIEEAIGLLRVRKLQYASAEESALINVRIPQLEARLAKLRADRIAFLAGYKSIKPPTAADVARAKQLVGQLEALVAQTAKTRAVIAIASRLVRLTR